MTKHLQELKEFYVTKGYGIGSVDARIMAKASSSLDSNKGMDKHTKDRLNRTGTKNYKMFVY